MSVDLTQHSPLGGSGTYRWMPCPGSVRLSYGVEDLESEYATIGIAAHGVGEHCLKIGDDAWEWVGASIDAEKHAFYHANTPEGAVLVDKPMADAVQVYLDAFRGAHPNFHNDENGWVEMEFHCPKLHKYFWGKSDSGFWDEPARTLHVWDYKHGAGIVVEVPQNPQLMYYACGILTYLKLWDEIDQVILWVAQPNGFHGDGPIRSWAVSTEDLIFWLQGALIPAMDRALTSSDTASGPHCRFCPARARACPQILKDLDKLEMMMDTMDLDEKDAARELTNEEVACILDLQDVAKIAAKAAATTAFVRAEAGHKIPGRKLVKARSTRVWREGAEEALKKELGYRLYDPVPIKSPAKVEKMTGGEKLCARYAFKPDKGRTLARADDPRMAVGDDAKAMFATETKKRKAK